MKTAVIIIGIVLLVLIAFTLLLGYGLASFMVHPKCLTLDAGREYEDRTGFLRDYESFPKEEYVLEMQDGYKIHTIFVPAPEPTDKYVIITHGYTANRYGAVKYLHMYRDFGYNCVIYDDRGHGLNERTICTMGMKESKDLTEIIRDTFERYGKDIKLGLHGESMGSAMTVYALGEKPNVKFAVIDCGFADLMNVIQEKIKSLFHLPSIFCYPASLMCKLFFGYWVKEVQPIQALTENEVPLCFMHGEDDDFILYSNSIRMSEATKGYSEVNLFPGATHAVSITTDEERYRKVCKEFLEKVGM